MTTEDTTSEAMYQIEWLTGSGPCCVRTCEWRLPERCQQRPAARLTGHGALTLYICEEHALEYRRDYGAKFTTSVLPAQDAYA